MYPNQKSLPQLDFGLGENSFNSYGPRAGAASMTQPPPRQCRVSPRRSASVRVIFTVPMSRAIPTLPEESQIALGVAKILSSL
jgi:hypothetical protein